MDTDTSKQHSSDLSEAETDAIVEEGDLAPLSAAAQPPREEDTPKAVVHQAIVSDTDNPQNEPISAMNDENEPIFFDNQEMKEAKSDNDGSIEPNSGSDNNNKRKIPNSEGGNHETKKPSFDKRISATDSEIQVFADCDNQQRAYENSGLVSKAAISDEGREPNNMLEAETDQKYQSFDDYFHELVGKAVIILRGNGTGIVAKVAASRKGGDLLVDHPSMTGKLVPAEWVRLWHESSRSGSPTSDEAVAANARSLVGHFVLISRDIGAGLAGTVLDSHDSGLIRLDNPSLDQRFVKARNVRSLSIETGLGVIDARCVVGKAVKISKGVGTGLVATVLDAKQSFIIVDHPLMTDKFVHTALVELAEESQDSDDGVGQDDQSDIACPHQPYYPSLVLVGKFVRIIGGCGVGKKGTVTEVGRSGYVFVDHPLLKGKRIHVRNVQVMNEMQGASNDAGEGGDHQDWNDDDDVHTSLLSHVPLSHTLFGMSVHVVAGTYAGNSGKVVEVARSGYVFLDNPSMEGKKVHVKNIRVHDGNNEMEYECDNSYQGEGFGQDDSPQSASPATTTTSLSLLGKNVYVKAGSLAGTVGKVIEVGKGGHVIVNHPSKQETRVHVRYVQVVDDAETGGTDDKEMGESVDSDGKIPGHESGKQDSDNPTEQIVAASRARSLLGKMVYVKGGTYEGTVAKVVEVGNRTAYLLLDHPSMEGKRVHVKYVRVLDDSEFDDFQVGECSGSIDGRKEAGPDLAKASSSAVPYSVGLVGKTVHIMTGTFAGKSGKVLEAGKGAYLVLDNPSLDGKRVHVKHVRVLEDMQDDKGETCDGGENSDKHKDDVHEVGQQVRREPKKSISYSLSLLGKTVKVTGGTFVGKWGKVIEVGKGCAFVVLDNPSMAGKLVHVKNLRVVHDADVDINEGGDNIKDSGKPDHRDFDTSSAPVSSPLSLVGKTVCITAGCGAGNVGKIVDVAGGSFVFIDHPSIEGKRVHVKNVQVVDVPQGDNSALSERGETCAEIVQLEEDSSNETRKDSGIDANGSHSTVSVTQSLIGKLVYITAGCGAGNVGTVLEVGKGAYLVVDHPSLEGKRVHVRNVRVLDASNSQMLDDLPQLNLETKTGNWGRPQPTVSSVESVTPGSVAHLVLLRLGKKPKLMKAPDDGRPQHCSEQDDPGMSIDGKGEHASSCLCRHVDDERDSKYAKGQLDMYADQDAANSSTPHEQSDLKLMATGSIAAEKPQEAGKQPPSFVACSELTGLDEVTTVAPEKSITVECRTAETCIPAQMLPMEHILSSNRSLPPIVIESNESGLPASLSHLPPDHKVDVFNLRTGKVMTGSEAVVLRDLPKLLQFAEYEPIAPPPNLSNSAHDCQQSGHDLPFVRQGRSGPNLRICSEVRPQERPSRVFLRNQGVVMKQGPFCGCIGFITHRYPGGRYQVETMKDGTKYKINATAQQFELLPEPNDQRKSQYARNDSLDEKQISTILPNLLPQELVVTRKRPLLGNST